MNRLKLGLFSQFFFLFSVTTILLALCLVAAYYVISEEEALKQLDNRYDSVIALFNSIERNPKDFYHVAKYSEEIKGDILIEHGGNKISSDEQFPEVSLLLQSASQLRELHYTKLNFRYYLMFKLDDGWIAITSTPFNLMVYSKWTVFWPWLAVFTILLACYGLLRKWFRPLIDVFAVMKNVSNGDFSKRIERHPNNEFSDLTKGVNKMSDEIKLMLDAKNELLLAISHELRTPLARTKVSLAMTEDNPHLHNVKGDINQMELLIEQLLEGERLEAGHQALHLTNIFLPIIIEELLSESAQYEKVSIVGHIPEVGLPLDIGRFKFLLRNLISNALKHNNEEINCKLSVDSDVNEVVIKVSDEGIGIPDSSIPHIFEPFYRVNNSKHRDTNGTGLGLYICKKIAEAHGGALTVQSELEKGTTFIVRLPVD